MIRVALVDDRTLVRSGIPGLLDLTRREIEILALIVRDRVRAVLRGLELEIV